MSPEAGLHKERAVVYCTLGLPATFSQIQVTVIVFLLVASMYYVYNICLPFLSAQPIELLLTFSLYLVHGSMHCTIKFRNRNFIAIAMDSLLILYTDPLC